MFQREAAILTAARLFWRYGYSGTSTRALTTALGLSTSSLYAAFGSKAGLFEATVHAYVERYHTIYVEAVSQTNITDVIETLLTRSVEEFTQPSETHPGCITSSAVMSDSAETLDSRSYIDASQSADEESLKDRFILAHKQGQFSSEANAIALFELVQCTLQGLSVMTNRGADQQRLLSTVRVAVELASSRICPIRLPH